MKHRTEKLFLFAAVLFLTSCTSLSYTQREESQTEVFETGAGRFYREIPEGCVSAEEFNYLTGIWNSGQDTFALEIPLCDATEYLLWKNKKNAFAVITSSPDAEEAPKTSPQDHELHTYAGYTLCYRESYEQSEWVAYSLTREKVEGKVIGRTNDFRADTLISTGSASPADYKGSGFDRGHLAPAADMEWSTKSAHDSFLMSNMSPQAPAFNRTIWRLLEEEVRKWAFEYECIYVVTGPVLEKEAERYESIGENQVSVPEYFYKALLVFLPVYESGDSTSGAIEYYRVQCAAFIIPNKSSGKDIFKFICPIDMAEERTGLDFFANLPDEVEEIAESQCGEIFLEP